MKKDLEEWRMGLGRGTPNKGPMEDDAKNRLKSAELLLDQFENEENRKALQAKRGWSDAEYEKFLDGYRKRVDQLREEMKNRTAGDKLPAPDFKEPYTSTPIKTGVGEKVEGRPGTGTTTGTTPTAAPPGFEDARQRFLDALKKKP
jgi:collagen type III alpha